MNKDLLMILLASICSFVITYGVIPSVLELAYKKKLFDTPNERKVHTQQIPSLGGIGIFIGVLITLTAFASVDFFASYKFIFISYLILFLVGLKDDLVPMSAKVKFVIQILIAILLIQGGIQINSLNGLFGIEELNVWASYLLTIVFIVGVTNAFNLIDGIDGLAGGLGGINCVTLGVLLFWVGEINYAILGFAVAGSLLAFLRYNFGKYPNKIFMGDAGSLLLGLTITILAIRFMESPLVLEKLNIISPFGIVAGIIFIPVFDTLRVFTIRLAKGLSPFTPDRSHIHHEFLSSGLTHRSASILLYIGNLLLILTVLIFRNQPTIILLVLSIGVSTVFVYSLLKWRYRYRTTKVKVLEKELKSIEEETYMIS